MNYELRIMNNEVQKIRSFDDLHAWQEGHKLVLMIYEVTKGFPSEELYGLISQLRRCAVSITSNIAEGFSRQSYKEKLQFYSMSQWSVPELQSQVLVAKDVNYISNERFQEISEQAVIVHKLLNGLIKSTRNKA